MNLSRGQRIKLSDISQAKKFVIKVSTENNKDTGYDISCFGLDENNKCSDDSYLIFYNQKQSPCNGITLLNSTQKNTEFFEIDLSKISQKIKKLVFTMTVDGTDTMSDLKEGSLLLFENSNSKGGYKFTGSDFSQEKSIMISEIYIKDEWRFAAVGQGFNGGLSSLLEHFGIEEEINEPENNTPINSNTNSDSTPIVNAEEKNYFSGFFKNILSAPFKYAEKKKDEIKERNEKQAKELDEYNHKKSKENKFKELLIDYLSDGVLTSEEMTSLNSFCGQNSLNLQECLLQSQWEIESFLRLMLANIVSDNIITDEEQNSINSVFKFLNPSYTIKNEIEETIKRVKSIQNIKSGNIPVITNPSVITKISELVWHSQPNVRLIRQLSKETKSHEGEVIVTSERVIFKSYDYPTEILLKNILNFEVDGYNFYIVGKSSKSTSLFRLDQSEILEAYLDQALNKFHRKLDFSHTANNTRRISQSVKQEVWGRDRGQCVECQDKQYLEYDHIIPFSKGGSNSAKNIQLLCRKCNLVKSDRI